MLSGGELLEHDKASLEVFWSKDSSPTDLDNRPVPDELAEHIIEDLEADPASLKDVLAAIESNTSHRIQANARVIQNDTQRHLGVAAA